MRRLGRGVCFLSYPCCHGYNRVCVPSHALSKQSHSRLCPPCHPFSLSDTYCDKMHCMVEQWNLCGTAKSHRRSCDCAWVTLPPWLMLTETACWADSIANNLNSESHSGHHVLRNQGNERCKEAPLQHLRLSSNPVFEESPINVLLGQHAAFYRWLYLKQPENRLFLTWVKSVPGGSAASAGRGPVRLLSGCCILTLDAFSRRSH